jgi:hypothetical protein
MSKDGRSFWGSTTCGGAAGAGRANGNEAEDRELVVDNTLRYHVETKRLSEISGVQVQT